MTLRNIRSNETIFIKYPKIGCRNKIINNDKTIQTLLCSNAERRNPFVSPNFVPPVHFFSPSPSIVSLLVFGCTYLCQIREGEIPSGKQRGRRRGSSKERDSILGIIEKMRHLSADIIFSRRGAASRLGNEISCSKRVKTRESSGKITRRRGIVINGVRVPWLVLPRSYPSRRSSYLIAFTPVEAGCNRDCWRLLRTYPAS